MRHLPWLLGLHDSALRRAGAAHEPTVAAVGSLNVSAIRFDATDVALACAHAAHLSLTKADAAKRDVRAIDLASSAAVDVAVARARATRLARVAAGQGAIRRIVTSERATFRTPTLAARSLAASRAAILQSAVEAASLHVATHALTIGAEIVIAVRSASHRDEGEAERGAKNVA